MTFTRYELTIPVELTSELHIGGVDEVPERDGEGTVIRFCRNGLKEPTIPGRSIRGAVRAACDIARQAMKDTGDPATQNGEAFSKENWISLWGDDTDYTGKSLLDRRLRSDDSLPIRQSALTFHAVSFPEYKDSDSGGCSPLPRRHGVGIDRTTGAASDGALYEHEFLPRGTKFDIRITAEGRDDETMGRDQSEGIPGSASSEVIELLLHLIRSLFESEAISLGGRTGSGQGCIKVQGSKEERQDSAKQYLRIVAQSKGIEGKKPVDIVDALTGALSEGPESSKGTDSSAWAGSKPAHIKIKWWSPTGIFVAEDEKLTKRRKEEAQKKNPEANGVTEPLRDPSVPWDEAQLLIPGTSIRGALRSRASRIARTVLAAEAENKLTPFTSHDVHEQIAAEPNLVRYMFGCTEYRGAITVHDCRSKKRGTRVEVTHNVIDRWTGGVIDGGLFTEAVYLGTHWEPITIDIDLRQLLSNIEAEKGEAKSKPKKAETKETEQDDQRDSQQREHVYAPYAGAAYVLLGLVLAELSAGTLPLGSRSTRGLGQVVVSLIDVRGCTRDGVVIPAKTLSGGEALEYPGTAASRPTQDRYDAQRTLAGDVLEYLREDIMGAPGWSDRLDDAPEKHGAQSTDTEKTHE